VRFLHNYIIGQNKNGTFYFMCLATLEVPVEAHKTVCSILKAGCSISNQCQDIVCFVNFLTEKQKSTDILGTSFWQMLYLFIYCPIYALLPNWVQNYCSIEMSYVKGENSPFGRFCYVCRGTLLLQKSYEGMKFWKCL
jgi:hypothetical protein